MQSQNTDYKIRFAGVEDLPFLQEMLYEAAYWRLDQERPTLQDSLLRPDLHKLLSDWGRAGDTAVIAYDEDKVPLGAAWYRFWTMEDHSYGFLDELTPEIGIGVTVGKRGRGIGTYLLQALLHEGKEQGVKRMCLSVQPDNYARQIYKKFGFRDVELKDGAWTMVIDLELEPKKI